jgi:tetratricopeptide (TPR) repeat protein
MKPSPARPVSRRAPDGRAGGEHPARSLCGLAALLLVTLCMPARAQNAAPGIEAPPAAALPADEAASAPEPVNNSSLDAPMFYQLLVGEMEAQAGRQSNAFEVMLDAARRSKDGGLFQRAIELAIQGRSGDRALAAAAAWRSTMPDSIEALRTQVQLLVATDKLDELVDPLRALIEQVPEAERSSVILGLPRFLSTAQDKVKVLAVAQKALAPFVDAEKTRSASHTALGRLALAADQADLALELMRRAHQADPAAAGPVLLALDLMPGTPAAEATVQDYLARPDALNAVRLAYVQALDQRQRIGEAVVQLRLALAQQADTPQAWLTLGAYLVELQEPREASGALQRFIALQGQVQPSSDAAAADDENADRGQRALDYAYGLLAEAAEQMGDIPAATAWLNRIDASRIDLPLLNRKAALMAHQGHLKEARALVRDAPVRGEVEPRARLLAEVQLLREAKQWQTAYDLLLAAMREAPQDNVLIYELAMVTERMARYDDMEVLLRRVIAIKPDDAHAYNALGYSLAERNLRLDEARTLIVKATELAPTDPFIADSLGWIEFRLGHADEALRLLRVSHLARPHVEVAAHLGEVLWSMGQQDEARRIWREGRARQADNEVLVDTLRRLKVSL